MICTCKLLANTRRHILWLILWSFTRSQFIQLEESENGECLKFVLSGVDITVTVKDAKKKSGLKIHIPPPAHIQHKNKNRQKVYLWDCKLKPTMQLQSYKTAPEGLMTIRIWHPALLNGHRLLLLLGKKKDKMWSTSHSFCVSPVYLNEWEY